MAVEYTCDQCGKKECAKPGKDRWEKPNQTWFERVEGEKVQCACSQNCAMEIAKGMGIEIPIRVQQ